jgi:hypothetical protein
LVILLPLYNAYAKISTQKTDEITVLARLDFEELRPLVQEREPALLA